MLYNLMLPKSPMLNRRIVALVSCQARAGLLQLFSSPLCPMKKPRYSATTSIGHWVHPPLCFSRNSCIVLRSKSKSGQRTVLLKLTHTPEACEKKVDRISEAAEVLKNISKADEYVVGISFGARRPRYSVFDESKERVSDDSKKRSGERASLFYASDHYSHESRASETR